jgi:hypothetical protein
MADQGMMAKVPDLRNSTLRGVQRPADRRIIIPGEDQEEIDRVYGPRTPRTPVRLQLPQADMQEQLRSPEPPVRKAANDLMEEYIAQVTPKNMGYGFESDMGGTFGGPDNIYIRGTFPDEEGYRERQFDRMKERMGNPFRGASRGMGEDTLAQLAPQNVRNVTAPSSMPYIKTPSEKRADEMLMQRLGNQLSPNDMRFFLEGNYGYSGV